jgi:hypothetical protein
MDTVGRLFKVIEWFGHEDLDNSEYISPITLDSYSFDKHDLNDLKKEIIDLEDRLEHMEITFEDDDEEIYEINYLIKKINEKKDKLEHLEIILEDDEGDIF